MVSYDEMKHSEQGPLTVLGLMKVMIRGGEVAGVASTMFGSGDGEGPSGGVIYSDDIISLKVHRSYATTSGLVGHVVHLINKSNRSYPCRLDQIKLKGLLAVSMGVMNHITEVVPPSGTKRMIRKGNSMVEVYADSVPLYLVMEK
jgi:hypothetical protein